MAITKLEQMLDLVRQKPKKTLVAAYANDSHTIEAVSEAIDMGIVDGTLVGDEKVIQQVCKELKIDASKFQIIHEPQESKAAAKAVALINDCKGNLLMKGLVSTDKYMKAILDKEKGLMNPGAILSHVTVVENPHYHKLLIVSDVAIIPAPDIKQKVAIANFIITIAHGLGIEKPKIAAITATEQMLPGMPACVDAAILAKMSDRGQIKGGVIDGPLALDVAIDKESAEIKKVKSEVAGDADGLLFPNIESGNVFYKANTKLAGGEQCALVMGARVPCVLTSRGDSAKAKLFSIALGALIAQ
ncbi:MAG: bifunctional enoyl-CoA hydratase/phosphate acetyltransferase [Bacteroidetes bacterium]|nr:bifunctional enoyl-CoA hydratase/phosphate acetyltransferase [Bacteroidota bacterium]